MVNKIYFKDQCAAVFLILLLIIIIICLHSLHPCRDIYIQYWAFQVFLFSDSVTLHVRGVATKTSSQIESEHYSCVWIIHTWYYGNVCSYGRRINIPRATVITQLSIIYFSMLGFVPPLRLGNLLTLPLHLLGTAMIQNCQKPKNPNKYSVYLITNVITNDSISF